MFFFEEIPKRPEAIYAAVNTYIFDKLIYDASHIYRCTRREALVGLARRHFQLCG